MRRSRRRRGEMKMMLRLVSILSIAILIVLPAQLDAFITQNTGCHHNGTWFADKSIVPSMEKCLNCQCNRKTLVCRLKVCPEMPMPPPRGCVVVQKKNSCCPYLSCARLDAFYKIPTKRRIIAYLDHYERESIDRVVNDNMLQRRSDDSDVDLFVCVKNGTVYKSGSAMSSSNLCSYCYCIGGTEKCVKPKCMLPVEGCKPIFVDSTCCPVRYDCSSKTSGKSSQEVRYRKTSNKHFQRMSQRLQRNRGCTVDTQFYAEGQKMRSDADRPCDICFCIRGTRRCAPKKCSPALKNCIPVVPKGQCCPSSYDCGSQRDYRRSQSSRQFNLYNLLFGKEEQEAEAEAAALMPQQHPMAEHYPHDRHPTTAAPNGVDALQASSEKSIFDTLREGLEFIDGNNNQALAQNMDLVGLPKNTTDPVELLNETNSTTELSFLDLLLGPTTATPESTTTNKPISWVDLLLGPDEEEHPPDTSTTTLAPPGTTLSSIKRFADDFDDQLHSGEIAVGELPAEAQQLALNNWSSSTAKPPDLLNVFLDGLSDMLADNSTTTTTTTSSSTTTTTTTIKPPTIVRAPPMFRPLPSNKPLHNRINSKLANLTITPQMVVVTSKYGQPVTYRTLPSTTSTTTTTTTTTTSKPSTTTKKPTTTSTTKAQAKTTRRTSTTTNKPTTTTTPRTTRTTRTTLKPKQTPNITKPPLIIQTNPNILEAEPFDDNDSTAPTLPPSLPNLKIIPFLPADAVNTAPELKPQSSYSSPNYYTPSQIASDKMDIDYETPYDETASHYPAITSAQPLPQSQAHYQAAYKYKFNVEVPAVEPAPEPVVQLGSGQYEGSADYVKYDFDQQVVPPAHSGFSPPTETEGGFMPKEPLVIDGEVLQDHVTSNILHALADNYHVTQHIIDITTPMSLQTDNDTLSIEITTPDPFKDVIHTEKPPDLEALIIEKQQKKPTTQQQHQEQQQQLQQHTDTVSYSISNSSGPTTTAATLPTTTTTATSTTEATTSTKNTTLIDKNEINKLDQLLEELLGMEHSSSSSSTVPPFKAMPSTTATTASAITTTATATTLRTAATTRGNKKGNKTKNKITANRRNNATATIPTKSAKNKIRTTVSSNNKQNAPLTAAATPKPSTTVTTTTTTTAAPATTTVAASTVHPFLMSPFDKLPFMDASYEVRPHMLQKPQQQLPTSTAPPPQQFHHYQHAPSSSSSSTTATPITAGATPAMGSGLGNGGSLALGLGNPTGMLKLAGCNIYGRMYRVGRIIVELSNQCLECKCTEVGVKCGPLDC